MRPDFEKGFISVERKERQEGKPALLSCYNILEIKEAEVCVNCKSTDFKKNRNDYVKPPKKVYAVVDDQFAFCELHRWEYYCYGCEHYFYNTETPHPYERKDKFSENFVRKALETWLTDKEATLRSTAADIGIKKDALAEWDECLYRTFSPIKPVLKNSLVFASFEDSQKNKRGFICQRVFDRVVIVAFMDDYSAEWIDGYLSDIQDKTSGVFSEIPEIYFDYAPGLAECLKKRFRNAKVGINRNKLYSQITHQLKSFTVNQATDFRNRLTKLFFSVDPADTYAVTTVPRKLSEMLKKIPEEDRIMFRELEEREDDRYLIASYRMELTENRFSTDPFRKTIRKMVKSHRALESIAVKMLYDTDSFKADIDDILIRCCFLGKQIAFGRKVKQSHI